MPVAVLTILKFCLVALIFLFLTRVLRAVWVEINAPIPGSAPAGATTAGSSTDSVVKPDPRPRRRNEPIPTLTVVEPVDRRGDQYPLETEMTIGRAPGCAIVVTDSFASQLHARLFERESTWYVEDLGSRNGTWLNRTQVHGATKLEPGDLVKVGDTVLELGFENSR
jgi:pSer/pThr/pTyr-binding forkhead associated (FHA) protein